MVTLGLAAQVSSASGGQVIHSIAIDGNHRTARAYVLALLNVAPGDTLGPSDAAVLEQRLMNSRLFLSARVESREDQAGGVLLQVCVVERWTLIPLPMLGASSGSVSAGLTLLESNLFGRGKNLVLGAVASNRSASWLVGYRDPAVLDSRWLLSADLAQRDDTRIQYRGADRVYEYRDRRTELALGTGYQLTRALTVRVGWFEVLPSTRAVDGFAPPPRPGPVRGISAGLEWRDEEYHLWTSTGASAGARYRQGLEWLGGSREFRTLSATATYSHLLFREHVVSATLQLDAVRGDPVVDALPLGGRRGSRGFNVGGLWAESASTLTLEYQIPVWRPRRGALTVLGFVDGGLTRWRGVATDYVNPGAGVRLHLGTVAMPALGLDLAYSPHLRQVVPTAFLGMQF